MDYYNMMYGRVRHAELIEEAQRENRVLAENRAVSGGGFFARITVAVQHIFTRSVAAHLASQSRQLAAK
ncbi:MAG: hypothetical protein NTZ50_02680 [Chloroflexi bacterium]|nr:hypothetical protein [Chloroflexota bacterium]